MVLGLEQGKGDVSAGNGLSLFVSLPLKQISNVSNDIRGVSVCDSHNHETK